MATLAKCSQMGSHCRAVIPEQYPGSACNDEDDDNIDLGSDDAVSLFIRRMYKKSFVSRILCKVIFQLSCPFSVTPSSPNTQQYFSTFLDLYQ